LAQLASGALVKSIRIAIGGLEFELLDNVVEGDQFGIEPLGGDDFG
jgi:hypothetical protein